MIQQHEQRKPSIHVLDQARSLLHYKEQLSAFKASIPRHRESICAIEEVIKHGCDTEQPTTDASRRKRRESISKLAGMVEREEMRFDDDNYDQGWVNEVARQSKRSIDSIIFEEDEDGEILQTDRSFTPNHSTSEMLKRPISPLTKGLYLPSFPGSHPQGIFFSRPAFRLDVFESFSCTNTPATTPPSSP